MARFKCSDNASSQIVLFPRSLDDSIPAESEVRLLGEVLDRVDWSVMESGYSDLGTPPYPPRVLASVLLYAYSKGIRSSRKIEELVENDKRYMWLANGMKPDHNTIARFRKSKGKQLKSLFVESIRLCCESGLVLMRAVCVDSTKVEASASDRSMYNAKRMLAESLAIDQILREAEEVDAAEDAKYGESNGRELPEELRDPVKRKAKLEEIARRLREEKAKSTSSSDPECRVMIVGDRLRPAYSLEAVVDTQSQVIVGMDVTNDVRDVRRLSPLTEQATSNTGMKPGIVLADSGYSDEQTMSWIGESGQDAIIVPLGHPGNKKEDLFSSRCFILDEEVDELICPAGRRLIFKRQCRTGSGTYRRYAATGCQSCSFHAQCCRKRASRCVSVSVVADVRERIRRVYHSDEGRRIFAFRKQTVEPVFGRLKTTFAMSRLSAWGKSGATSEAAIAFTAHNLWKVVAAAIRHLSIPPPELTEPARQGKTEQTPMTTYRGRLRLAAITQL
jgi:transposase